MEVQRYLEDLDVFLELIFSCHRWLWVPRNCLGNYSMRAILSALSRPNVKVTPFPTHTHTHPSTLPPHTVWSIDGYQGEEVSRGLYKATVWTISNWKADTPWNFLHVPIFGGIFVVLFSEMPQACHTGLAHFFLSHPGSLWFSSPFSLPLSSNSSSVGGREV